MKKGQEPQTLRIELPANRDYVGRIALLDKGGRLIAGPFAVCGRAGDELATEHGNRSRAATLPYGDTPLGTYRIVGFVRTGSGTKYRADLFGVHGAFVLEAISGDAALAEANGRFEVLIHGGRLSPDGKLRATSGNIRIADADLSTLSKLIIDSADVICECIESKPASTLSLVELRDAEDTTVKHFAAQPWVIPYTRRILAPALVAYGEYDSGDFDVSSGSEPSTTNVPYTPPDPPAQPVMRPREYGDGDEPERPEESHDLEDEETRRRSEGEGQGETPEAP
jgi:hypothetical protein